MSDPLTPQEALAFWRAKKPLPPDLMQKLDAAARKRAFFVSGLAKKDMLADLHASLEEAIAQGEPLEQWKKRIPEILETTGWRGRRLETIFQTNTQTAYMAGRYMQMQETVKSRPYWQYVAVEDERSRPQHLALNGLVFPADHPFWGEFYPPNGFNCRCTVVTLSERQVKREGLEIETGTPRSRIYADHEGHRHAVHNLAPDQGFAGNPAKEWLEQRPIGKGARP